MHAGVVGPDSYAHDDTRIVANKPAVGLILGGSGFSGEGYIQPVVIGQSFSCSFLNNGGKHGGHSSGDGSHGHTITPPQIKPGDRVLVAWVMNEACVIDVVTGS